MIDIMASQVPLKVVESCSLVREWMAAHYGTGVSLAGHCIEASELLCGILQLLGYTEVECVEGWCRYDDDTYCTYPYDAHTWVELISNDQMYYLDVTVEQFNYGMLPENRFDEIVISEGLPHGIVYSIDEVS